MTFASFKRASFPSCDRFLSLLLRLYLLPLARSSRSKSFLFLSAFVRVGFEVPLVEVHECSCTQGSDGDGLCVHTAVDEFQGRRYGSGPTVGKASRHTHRPDGAYGPQLVLFQPRTYVGPGVLFGHVARRRLFRPSTHLVCGFLGLQAQPRSDQWRTSTLSMLAARASDRLRGEDTWKREREKAVGARAGSPAGAKGRGEFLLQSGGCKSGVLAPA
eukprot:scaffold31_cov334-Pavlova_lutheri.AAC.39